MNLSKRRRGTGEWDAAVAAGVTRMRVETVAEAEKDCMVPTGPTHAMLRMEGEDAKLTGMTRSLSRRLMGLNCPVAEVMLQELKLPECSSALPVDRCQLHA